MRRTTRRSSIPSLSGLRTSSTLKRGELWTAAGGQPCTAKLRPVLIVQDDRFVANDSITTCPLTSDETDLPLFRVKLVPNRDNGLRRDSYIMTDKISTIPRVRMARRLGHVTAGEMASVERAILVFLGIAGGHTLST